MSAKALAAKVLCKRHNEALSALDVRAGQLFRELQAADRFLDDGPGELRVYLFNGHDLERWLLKLLCGAVAADVIDVAPLKRPWRPTSQWLRILFYGEAFPARWGLYVPAPIGYTDRTLERVEAATISNATAGLYGLTCTLRDKRLVLAMSDPGVAPPRGSILADAVYRPSSFEFRMSGRSQLVRFSWDAGTIGSGIVWDYARRTRGVEPAE